MKINLLHKIPKSNSNFIKTAKLSIEKSQRKIFTDAEIAQLPTTQVWDEIKTFAEKIITIVAK